MYKRQVKCIYIDPPYNANAANIYEDNIEHSLWLNLIRPRLQIMWRLLGDTGSKWISIDDNERDYLKVLCDEVFGRSSFLASIVWQKRYSRENREAIGDSHEYILVYVKDKDAFKTVSYTHLDVYKRQEEYKAAPLRLGQLQRYLNAAEQLGVLPLIYTGLSSGLRQCELITLSWADFHVRYRYILKGQRLLSLNAKAEHLLKQMPETDSPYVFLNPKTGAPYKLYEFYYLHKKILKQARLPWVAFRDLQCQCMEVGI